MLNLIKLHEIMIFFFREENKIDKKRITREYFSYLKILIENKLNQKDNFLSKNLHQSYKDVKNSWK